MDGDQMTDMQAEALRPDRDTARPRYRPHDQEAEDCPLVPHHRVAAGDGARRPLWVQPVS